MKLERIALFAETYFVWLWPAFARLLAEEHNAAIDLFCGTSQDRAVYEARGAGVFRQIYTTRQLYDTLDPMKGDEARVVAEAAANEARHGIRMVDLLMADRHVGLAYCTGGPGHPRSKQSLQVTYPGALRVANAALAFFERYFLERRPDLVIGTAGSLIGKAWNVVARTYGLTGRAPARARHADLYYWAEDEFLSTSRLRPVYESLSGGGESEGPVAPYNASLVSGRMLDRGRFSTMVRQAVRRLAQRGYWWSRGYEKTNGYLVRDELAYYYHMWKDFRELAGVATWRATDLRRAPFVVMPLQVEPEATMGVLSPEFNDQLAAIHFVVKHLPAGVRLAIKEHVFAVGRRPRGFYARLAEIPQVALVDVREEMIGLVRESLGVVVFTSTTGQEAAILGKPVLTFSQHNLYDFLPHVSVVRGWDGLRDAVARLCVPPTPEEAWSRRRDGARFLRALRAISFDISDMKAHGGGRPEASADEARRFLGPLLESLDVAIHA